MNIIYEIDLAIIKKAFQKVEEIDDFQIPVIEEIVISKELPHKKNKKEEIEKFVKKIWENIQENFYKIYIEGDELKNSILSNIFSTLEQAKKEFGESFSLIILKVKQRIINFRKELYKQLINSFPHELNKEEYNFIAEKITLSYEFVIGGNIKTSITKLFEFASKGKFVIEIEYKKI